MLRELQSRYPFLGSGVRKAAELSHGEQQILELSMALLTEPRVLLLDEPCAGLSPAETAAVMEIVRWAAQRLGGAIIIIEHDMSLVKELAEVVDVLHNGTLLAKAALQRSRPTRKSGRSMSGQKMSAPRLTFEGLTGGYGSTTIVRDLSGTAEAVDVLVRPAATVSVNTLMKLLFGYLPCLSGKVLLDGKPVQGLDPSTRRRTGMTYCPQERPVFDDLSVRENLTLMRANRQLAPFRKYFDRFPILERRLAQHAGTLSGGEKKMLSFVRGLAEDQPIVLLDEPSEGVQWENILHMEASIVEKRRSGTAFIIVEQNSRLR